MTTALAVGGISIDYVTSPDGTASGHLLGGNATYGSFGASRWLEPGSVRLVGMVGFDFPRTWLDLLELAGVDIGHVQHCDDRPSMVWPMAYDDADGRQLAVPEFMAGIEGVPGGAGLAAIADGTAVRGEMEPFLTLDDLIHLDGAHCGPVQGEVLVKNLHALRGGDLTGRGDLTVLVDPGEESLEWDDDTRRLVLSLTDIYCPSHAELPSAEVGERGDVIGELVSSGPRTVVVKLGRDGCLVCHGGKRVHVPSCPADPVDPTGAGDTFCGAFLAAMLRYDDPLVAAVLGVATASVAIEHAGILSCLTVPHAVFVERARDVGTKTGVALPDLTRPSDPRRP